MTLDELIAELVLLRARYDGELQVWVKAERRSGRHRRPPRSPRRLPQHDAEAAQRAVDRERVAAETAVRRLRAERCAVHGRPVAPVRGVTIMQQRQRPLIVRYGAPTCVAA